MAVNFRNFPAMMLCELWRYFTEGVGPGQVLRVCSRKDIKDLNEMLGACGSSLFRRTVCVARHRGPSSWQTPYSRGQRSFSARRRTQPKAIPVWFFRSSAPGTRACRLSNGSLAELLQMTPAVASCIHPTAFNMILGSRRCLLGCPHNQVIASPAFASHRFCGRYWRGCPTAVGLPSPRADGSRLALGDYILFARFLTEHVDVELNLGRFRGIFIWRVC